MISVTEREQKKVKGWIKSRKAVNPNNGQSAAKFLSRKRFNEQTADIFGSLFLFEINTFIMGRLTLVKVKMSNHTGIVYQIENLKTGRIYIGSTSQNFGARIAQHIRSIGIIKSELYLDMSKSITDFSFQIIEDNIPLIELQQKESDWIHRLKSSVTGYNNVVVSGNERLTQVGVWEIKHYLLNTNLKFSKIGEMYNLSSCAVSDINLGRAWYNKDLSYPLRKKTVKRKRLTEQDIYDIYKLLSGSDVSFKQIASQYGWQSEAVVRKINNGTYSISPLPKNSYPIRPVDSRKGKRSQR